jgi:hypothetical protein
MVSSLLPGTMADLGRGQRTPGLTPSVIELWQKGDENWTTHHLAFLADHVGPILMNYDEGQGYRQMTQSMSLDIVKQPPIGGWEWLFLRHEMVVCENGRFWIDMVICDEEKEIVAVVRHQCVARPFEKYEKKSKL